MPKILRNNTLACSLSIDVDRKRARTRWESKAKPVLLQAGFFPGFRILKKKSLAVLCCLIDELRSLCPPGSATGNTMAFINVIATTACWYRDLQVTDYVRFAARSEISMTSFSIRGNINTWMPPRPEPTERRSSTMSTTK